MVFGFLAKECGWDYKYIIKNLTLNQIKRYFETIWELKKIEFVKNVEGNFHSTAAGFGSLKKDKFLEYLNVQIKDIKSIPKKGAHETIEDMKKSGLPIEDK